jgi:hypothetical protein
MAQLKIINRDICRVPILISVERSAYNKIKFVHDITSITITSTVYFEYSLDNGVTFVVLKTFLPNTLLITPNEVDAGSLTVLANDTAILFRLRSFNNNCGNRASNNIIIEWQYAVIPDSIYQLPEPFITCQGYGDSPTNFDVYCQGIVDFSLSSILGISYGFIRFVSPMSSPNPFGFQYIGGGAIPLNVPISVNTTIELIYADIGDNSSNYPWGNGPNPYPHINTNMQYSPNGVDWFTIIVNT